MNCPSKTGRGIGDTAEAGDLFLAYGSRTLSPADESALRLHMDACGECRRLAEAQRQVWSALEEWTPAPVASNFDERLYARIAAEQRKPWWTRAWGGVNLDWSWRPAMPVAAACAALVAAFLLTGPVPEHRPPGSVQHNVQTGVDIEQVERALDDMDMLKQLGLASTKGPGAPIRQENL